MLLSHIPSGLAIAVVTVAIRELISALQVPSFDRLVPKYLQLESYYVQGSPSILTLILMSLALFTTGFIDVELHSISGASFNEFFVRFYSSMLLPNIGKYQLYYKHLQKQT